MGLPTNDNARKAIPIWTGVVLYFPDVMAAVAEVSRLGNDQHNPGEALHWARDKSTDQMNCAFRHMLDHSRGTVRDTDGTWHLAKAIWRLCAELQVTIERQDPPPAQSAYSGLKALLDEARKGCAELQVATEWEAKCGST